MRLLIAGVLVAALTIFVSPPARAAGGVAPEVAQKLYERVTPSLVAVQFTYDNELGRQEFSGAGIVIKEDGTTICQLAVFDMSIPDVQLKEFKIIVPDPGGKDPEEIDAKLLGRDERYDLVFLAPKEPSKDKKWAPVKFEDMPVKIGESVTSVGLLPKSAAYKTYFTDSTVSVELRGETPQILTQTGLAAMGSPVFNSEGKAIGLVNSQSGQIPWLNNPFKQRNPALDLSSVTNPPRFFLPARHFLAALSDPPTEGKPLLLPWVGVPDMTGLNKDVAEAYGLANQPAIQIGDIIPEGPGAKAGLKKGDIVVKLNGEALERGDVPEELPDIFRRQLKRMKPGSKVKLGVLRKKGEPLQDIELTTGEMPKRPNAAERWFAEDLGFVAREMVFVDTYSRHLKPDAKGVVVDLIKRQSAAASAGLHSTDLITELNREPVTSVDEFKKQLEQFRKDKPKEAVVMVVLREGQTQTIRIEPPQ
jgi:serine protease Do